MEIKIQGEKTEDTSRRLVPKHLCRPQAVIKQRCTKETRNGFPNRPHPLILVTLGTQNRYRLAANPFCYQHTAEADPKSKVRDDEQDIEFLAAAESHPQAVKLLSFAFTSIYLVTGICVSLAIGHNRIGVVAGKGGPFYLILALVVAAFSVVISWATNLVRLLELRSELPGDSTSQSVPLVLAALEAKRRRNRASGVASMDAR